eukprot:4150530-Alexandrium_andersonii.AAC.1
MAGEGPAAAVAVATAPVAMPDPLWVPWRPLLPLPRLTGGRLPFAPPLGRGPLSVWVGLEANGSTRAEGPAAGG